MALIGPVHNARLFNWDPEYGGLAEASDLGKGPFFGQLWDDACDEGFRIHNPRTGVTVSFILVAIDRDRENEIQAWRFVSHRPGESSFPFPKLKVTVFND